MTQVWSPKGSMAAGVDPDGDSPDKVGIPGAGHFPLVEWPAPLYLSRRRRTRAPTPGSRFVRGGMARGRLEAVEGVVPVGHVEAFGALVAGIDP